MFDSSIIKTSNSPSYPLSSLPPPGPPPTDALPGLPTHPLPSPGIDLPVSSLLVSGSTVHSSSPSSLLFSKQSSFIPFLTPDHDRSLDPSLPVSHTYDPSSRLDSQCRGRPFNPHWQELPDLIQPSLIHPTRSQATSTLPSYSSLHLSTRPSLSLQSESHHPLFDRSSIGMPRTPSRLLLQQALDLAQIAVGLDQAQEFHEAVVRYQETVSMLRIVMARIESRGSQSKAGIGDGRDDQGLTLKGIHDAYLSRISMLQEQLHPPDTSSIFDSAIESDAHIPQPEHDSSPTRVRSISPTNSRSASSSSESTVPPVVTTFHRPRRFSHVATDAEPSPAASVTEPSDASYLDRSASTTSSHRSSFHSRTHSLQKTPLSPSIYSELSAAQISSSGSVDPRATLLLNVDSEPKVHGGLSSLYTPISKFQGDEPDRSAFQRRQSLIESLGLFGDDQAGAEQAMTTAAKIRSHILEDVQESPRSTAKDLETDVEGEPPVTNNKSKFERTVEQGARQLLLQEVQAEAPTRLPTPDANPSVYERDRYNGYMSHESQAFSRSDQRPLPTETVPYKSSNSSVRSLPPISMVAGGESSSTVQPAIAHSQTPNTSSVSSLNGRSTSGHHSSLSPSIPPSVSTIEGSSSLLSSSPPSNGDNRKISYQSPDQFMVSPRLTRTASEQTSALPYPSVQIQPNSRSNLLERVPSNVLHRPFHLMRALRSTMVTPGGSYLTPRLHVPSGAWSQTGVFLQAVDTKVQVIHVLIDYLQAMEKVSVPFISTAMPKNTGSLSKLATAGVEFLSLLDSWENVMETVQTTLAKKNVVQHSKKGKNGGSNWGFKISRGLDRLANGKNIDTLQAYSSSLKRLFAQSQFLDIHLHMFNSDEPSSPNAPHLSLPPSIRVQIEARLKRTSEFFGQVVIAFVLKDMMLLLDKYTKNVEKWILE